MNQAGANQDGPARASEWVEIARLGKTRGLRGEIFGDGLTQDVDRYRALQSVTLFREAERVGTFTVLKVEAYKNRLLFRFVEAPSINEAERLTGCKVCIPLSERLKAAEGEYYLADLVGCEAFDRRTKQRRGTLADWQEWGGPPVFEIRRESGGDPLLVPFAKSIFVEIDLAGRKVELDLPEGLDGL